MRPAVRLLLWIGMMLLLGGCFSKGLTRRYPEAPRIPFAPQLRDFAGVLHIHSLCSHDSEGTLEEILAGGEDSGCDFLVVTDHNNSDLRSEEGFHRGISLLVGTELSTRAGHLLALGLSETPARDRPVAELIEEISQKGGMSIVAHPCSLRNSWEGGEEGFDGMEIFNLGSAFRKADRVSLFLNLLLQYPFSRRGVAAKFLRRPDAELEFYDRVSSKRHVVLFGGADAHRFPHVAAFLDLYSHLFPVVRTHVLAPDASAGELLQAMRLGRAYVAFDIFEDATGFLYWALLPDGKVATMGDRISFHPGLKLKASSPAKGRFVLYRNGIPVAAGCGESFEHSPGEGGVYRLEVSWERGRTRAPWIYSNPIWLD